MALKETHWAPDTCGCTYVYSWDTDLAVEDRVHTWVRTEISCPEHPSTEAGYLASLVENRRKNIAIGRGRTEVTGIDLNLITWEFSPDRSVLTVDFGGQLTGAQVSRIQSAVDLELGAGFVVIEP